MERWVGKVAVVTGASVGIGEAICIDLLKAGLVVVGLARRVELVEQIRDRVPSAVAGSLHAFKCDVTNETDIVSAFAWIDRALGGADILVNNAGLLQTGVNLVDAGNTAILKRILDTNVLGLVQCTREAFQSMRRRGVNDGHIVLINSICGHYVPVIPGCGPMNIYTASKHAVSAITEVLRQEFNMLQTRIKITVSLPVRIPNVAE